MMMMMMMMMTMMMPDMDEDLLLFREMRRCEYELESEKVEKLVSPPPILIKSIPASTTCDTNNTAEDIFSSDWDKHDYDWLMTPPSELPIRNLTDHEVSGSRFPLQNRKLVRSLSSSHAAKVGFHEPTSLHLHVSSRSPPPNLARTAPSTAAHKSSPLIANTTTTPALKGTLRASVSTGCIVSSIPLASTNPSRKSTPTKRSSTPTNNRVSSIAPVSSTSSLSSSTRQQPTISSRPSTPTGTRPSSSRSSTPTSKRTSTPTNKRSSTPRGGRPEVHVTPLGSTPTGKGVPTSNPHPKNTPSPPNHSNSNEKRKPSPSRNIPSSRQSSPSKSQASIPRLSLNQPPNLRTSITPQCIYNSRTSSLVSKPAAPVVAARAVSPSLRRGKLIIPSKDNEHNDGHSVSQSAVKPHNGGVEISMPVVGSKASENFIQTRRVADMAQEDASGTKLNKQAEKPKKPAISSKHLPGFGRNLSKASLDMALRHMDIHRSKPNRFGPIMANVPVSSIYSVRPGYGQGNGVSSCVRSPVATSSNASSDISTIMPDVEGNGFNYDSSGCEQQSEAFPSGFPDSVVSLSGGIMIKTRSEGPDNRDDGAETLQLFRQGIEEGFLGGSESPLVHQHGWFSSNHNHLEEEMLL